MKTLFKATFIRYSALMQSEDLVDKYSPLSTKAVYKHSIPPINSLASPLNIILFFD